MNKLAPYKTDEDLLQSTARIKSQRDIIRDRVNIMEQNKDRVTKIVYEKVRRDYLLQLQTINELLSEKKTALKKEIRELYIRREKLTVEINRHKEILEEAEFRHFLNEFTQAQYLEVEQFETAEIDKLQTDLTRIGEYIHQHEDLFDPEDLGTPSAQPQRVDIQVLPPAVSDVTRTVYHQASQPKATTEPLTRIEPESLKKQVSAPAEKADDSATRLIVDRTNTQAKQNSTQTFVTQAVEDNTDESDFEKLFADSDADVPSLAQSSSSIKAILDDNDVDQKSTSLEEEIGDEDYFSSDADAESLESSFHYKAPDELSVSASASVIQATQNIKNEEDVTDSKITLNKAPEPQAPSPFESSTPTRLTPQARPDDSISDILKSIHLDDEEEAEASISTSNTSSAITTTIPEGSYMLKLIDGDLEVKEYLLKDNLSIGRAPTNDIAIQAPKVSRQHAAINKYNDRFIIIDLKSSNGVFVNGTKVEEHILAPEDEISIGGYKFVLTKK